MFKRKYGILAASIFFKIPFVASLNAGTKIIPSGFSFKSF